MTAGGVDPARAMPWGWMRLDTATGQLFTGRGDQVRQICRGCGAALGRMAVYCGAACERTEAEFVAAVQADLPPITDLAASLTGAAQGGLS